MKKKRIVQYCCAALVAAGIGLNIQNAIENYGIGENSSSLVATGGTGSSGSGSCVESYPTMTSSWLAGQTIEQNLKLCGTKAGWWGVGFLVLQTGAMVIQYELQKTHQMWVRDERLISDTPIGDGLRKKIYECWEDCTEFSGRGGSNCDVIPSRRPLTNRIEII